MADAGKRVFTAERYKKRRSFSMSVAKPAAGPADGAASAGAPDAAMILEAIEELREEIADLKKNGGAPREAANPAKLEIDEDEEADVRIEIAQMVRSIGRTKSELAAIKHPMADDDRIKAASSELDEIVLATATATEDILHSTEHIGELLDEILARHPTDERLYALTEEAGQELVNIMEACSYPGYHRPEGQQGRQDDSVYSGSHRRDDRHLGGRRVPRPSGQGRCTQDRRGGAPQWARAWQ